MTTKRKMRGSNTLKAISKCKKPKIVGLYSRVNTQKQRATDLSIRRQKIWLAQYAKRHNFTNVRHYADIGYSANDLCRPYYRKLLSDIEGGLVGTVIVYSHDRVARNLADAILFRDLLDRHKVCLISIT